MEYLASKLLLPFLLPILLAAVKVGIDRFMPKFYAKIPKQVWLALVPVLAEASTTMSPDLLLFPGLPAWASTAVYTVGSVGVREFMTQLVKLVNGDIGPATTVMGTTGTPSGI